MSEATALKFPCSIASNRASEGSLVKLCLLPLLNSAEETAGEREGGESIN